MMHIISGRKTYVVDLPAPVELYFPVFNDQGPELDPYVRALNLAFEKGLIPGAGKYGIVVTGQQWAIYAINE